MSKDPLPAWFVERMMCDDWKFCLELSNGRRIGIARIDEVLMALDRTIWIDCTMLDDAPFAAEDIFTAPTSRLKISINAAHVVCAYEVADT